MINYSWVISAMDTKPSEDGLIDVVDTVHWRRVGSEIDGINTYSQDVFGAMKCDPPDPMAFTPYEDLTFEQVCSWLESKLNVSDLDSVVAAKIGVQKNPPLVQLPLPWLAE